MCGVCFGKGPLAEICADVIIAFACEADDASNSDEDKIPSREEQEAFVCGAPGKYFDEYKLSGWITMR